MQPRQILSNLKTALYRNPRDEIQRMQRWGAKSYFLCDRWKKEMEGAAATLPALEPSSSGPDLEVWFLTGKNFWYQTAFCAWTLAKASERNLVLNIISDGTLTSGHEAHLRRLFPKGITVDKESVVETLETHLPVESFPTLNARWNDYINIRKLIDVHLNSTGLKLVLDSDMIFLQRPDELLSWWDTQQQPLSPSEQSLCLMFDCEESYGYSRPLMEKLTQQPIPERLNVGVCGIPSELIDWDELEYWSHQMLIEEGTNYFLEQALVAMLASRKPHTVLPGEDYITFPSKQQVQERIGCLQHYVSDSKPDYFGYAWRHFC